MTNDELNEILKANPKLTMFGFGDNINYSLSDFGYIHDPDNTMTDEWLPNIKACIIWLRKQTMLANIKAKRTTDYGLKSHVERESGMYIPSGCMIVACIYLNTPFTRVKGTPYIWIPVRKNIV